MIGSAPLADDVARSLQGVTRLINCFGTTEVSLGRVSLAL